MLYFPSPESLLFLEKGPFNDRIIGSDSTVFYVNVLSSMKPQKALSSIGVGLGGRKSGYRLNPFRSSNPVGKSGTGNKAEVTEDESFL